MTNARAHHVRQMKAVKIQLDRINAAATMGTKTVRPDPDVLVCNKINHQQQGLRYVL